MSGAKNYAFSNCFQFALPSLIVFTWQEDLYSIKIKVHFFVDSLLKKYRSPSIHFEIQQLL